MKVDRYWVFSAQSSAKVTLALVNTAQEHQKLHSGAYGGNKPFWLYCVAVFDYVSRSERSRACFAHYQEFLGNMKMAPFAVHPHCCRLCRGAVLMFD